MATKLIRNWADQIKAGNHQLSK
uniref:Uncharacterized protein n=1 Tax=Physcomitrium patens TaxID=3218 RepID=A0A2K1JZH4_PHYPA|nr:hypothetical protein PHYPA_014046 [Physcomitrium patens]